MIIRKVFDSMVCYSSALPQESEQYPNLTFKSKQKYFLNNLQFLLNPCISDHFTANIFLVAESNSKTDIALHWSLTKSHTKFVKLSVNPSV